MKMYLLSLTYTNSKDYLAFILHSSGSNVLHYIYQLFISIVSAEQEI